MRMSWNVVNSPDSRREYRRVAGPLRDSVNSVILEDLISAAVSRCVEWLACHVDTKARMCDSTLGRRYTAGKGKAWCRDPGLRVKPGKG